VLAHVIPAFSQRHRGVHVNVELTMRVVDMTREGFDLALRVAPKLPSSTLIAKKVATLDLHLYAGASYVARRGLPSRIEALAEHEHVLFAGRDGRLTVVLDGPHGAVRTSLHGRVTCNDFLFARELIASGAGITALPWYVVRSELANGRLVRVLPEYRLASKATVFAVHAPQQGPSPKRDLFRRFLLEQAPKLFAQ
jgi:DNA-binding transcriptional LysR family regulator